MTKMAQQKTRVEVAAVVAWAAVAVCGAALAGVACAAATPVANPPTEVSYRDLLIFGRNSFWGNRLFAKLRIYSSTSYSQPVA